jgi:hypothetical protein
VPSRLVGHRVRLRIHHDRIEAYLGGSLLLTLLRGPRPKGAGAVRSARELPIGAMPPLSAMPKPMVIGFCAFAQRGGSWPDPCEVAPVARPLDRVPV